MREWGLLAGALCLATASMPVTAAQTARQVTVLQPSSAWIANYKDNSCALQRAFGDEQHRVFMELDDYTFGDAFRVTVNSAAFRLNNSSATVGFEPGAPAPAKELTKASFRGGRRGVIFDLFLNPAFDSERTAPDDVDGPPSDDARKEREKEITGLFVGGAFDTDLLLRTGSLSAPMDALRKCVDDLERNLGLDPVGMNAIATPPRPKNQGAWAAKIQNSYPAEAVMSGVGAAVRFRLIVGADGKVSDCYARPEGQLDVFAETACSLLKSYGTFDAARDASGNAVPSIYVLRIVWAIY